MHISFRLLNLGHYLNYPKYIYSLIYLVSEKIHIYLISFMIFKFCQQNSVSLEPSLILIIFIRCLMCSFIL